MILLMLLKAREEIFNILFKWKKIIKVKKDINKFIKVKGIKVRRPFPFSKSGF